jgi:rhodanese-related sulfurtransferase
MGDIAAKRALFDAFGEVGKALASGRRAEIVDLLAQGPRSVEEIANEIHQSVANTSHHLRLLATAGLLRSERDGNRVIYRLAGPSVLAMWNAIREVAAEHVAEIERLARAYLGDRSNLEAIERAELARRMRAGEVAIIDVRPEVEFEAGHIRGAISIPIDDLPRRLKELPRSKRIVAYCRGEFCVFADDAVRLLTRRGFDAVRLTDGFPEWKSEGRAVATGTASR